MPENAYRRSHLHQHLTRSRHGGDLAGYYRAVADLGLAARVRHSHPDWPTCTVCEFPIDPAAGGDGTRHPNCEAGHA